MLLADDKASAKLDPHSTVVTAGFGGAYVCIVPNGSMLVLLDKVSNYSKYAPFNDLSFQKDAFVS